MKLPALALKNAQFTLTIILLMVLVGIVSYLQMPRSEDPQFDLPITLIDVIYPGASPTDIETLVVDVLEDEISEIENIKKIESQVRSGGARITVEFVYGSDAEYAFNKVKRAVTSVKPQFPEGVQDVLVIKATPTSVAIVQLALWSEPTDYKTMEFYAKQLEKRIEAIPTVNKASLWGYPQQIVGVEVNLALLKHYGLSVTDINKVLQGRAINITPGFVDANTRRFNVKTSGNFNEINQIGETIIRSTSEYVLRLKDVADVEFSSREPNYLAYYDDKPVIFLTVEQRINTNIFQVTEQIQTEVDVFQKSLPSQMKIDWLFKQADSVDTRVNGFFNNLWQGLLLVGLISLVFLGLRESVVVIAAIPLSFLMAIGWLDFAGFGLEQMSIVGLIIALGLLVDNAIVVTESIHREKQYHDNISSAVLAGTKKVGWAISSGTATTMLAFLPMLMLSSTTGDFVRSMPVTVVLVLLASLIIALTLTPLLANSLFSTKENSRKTFQYYVNIFADNTYRRVLDGLINQKWIVIAVACVCLVGLFSLFPKVGVSLFPKAEKPMLLVDVETPANSSFEHTQFVMQKMTETFKKHPLIDKVALNIGSSNPRIYYNEIPKRGMVKYGQILLVLTHFNEADSADLVASLRQEFAPWNEAKITVKEFTQGPVTDQPITIRLVSDSLSELEQVSNDLAAYMYTLSGLINIENPIGEANTELSLLIDYDRAGLSLVDINTLDNTLKTVLSGANIGVFNDNNGEDYPIVVRRKKPDVDSLNDIEVVNTQGNAIPINQVLRTELSKGRTDFFHYQKLRMSKVSADVAPGESIKAMTDKVVEYLKGYPLPTGMYFLVGGEEESRQESFAGLTQIMLITAIGIFAVLILQFKSFLQPLIIFTSIPFAMAGAILGLYLCGLSFSMMAFIGLISLFGIVVNNAIILIDTANQNLAQMRAEHDSDDAIETIEEYKQGAIINASCTRFTPILLTTLTTVVGLLPLTILGGSLWQPLGVVIMAGLCMSAIASFLLVPALIAIFTRK